MIERSSSNMRPPLLVQLRRSRRLPPWLLRLPFSVRAMIVALDMAEETKAVIQRAIDRRRAKRQPRQRTLTHE